MSVKKKPVSTPLHLLQQLTGSLLDHFEQACAQALTDAEKMLAKLEKQRVKAQDKLHKQRARIDAAASAGKAKAQAKARASVEALEGALDELQRRQGETRQYIGQLKDDIQASLALVQGVGKVREAVGKALDQRGTASATPGVKTSRKPAGAKPPVAKPVVARAAAKPAASRKTATTPVSAVASILDPQAKPAATPRKPPLRKAVLAKAVEQAEESAAQPAPKRAPRKPRANAAAKSTGVPSSAPGSDTPASGS
ncbi:AlgP family protein [Pseudomonas sp. DC3000-4b1]|uniref:AlgP family protein n=1 Tax=unclassified Pseudomonas TaxID=196821 RepID=UPI003CEBDB09